MMAVRAPLAVPKRTGAELVAEVDHSLTSSKPTQNRTPARQGKRAAMVWLEPELVRQLNQIALDEDQTVQALMEEAVGMLFTSRGKPRLAG